MTPTPLVSAFQRQEDTLLNTWAYKTNGRQQLVKRQYSPDGSQRTLINRERFLLARLREAGSQAPELLSKTLLGS